MIAPGIHACPFCAGVVQIELDGVRHALPACHPFDALEAHEFVRHLDPTLLTARERLRRGGMN